MPYNEDALLRYAGELLNIWLSTTDEQYPIDLEATHGWIGPLGLPKTSYWAKFESREELWGSIKLLGVLCNAETLVASGEDSIEVRLS